MKMTVPFHLSFILFERARRADERRHVHVVSAGVHHADFLPGVVRRLHFARVGQPGFFRHRQAIEISANRDDRALAILHHADHAVARRVALLVFADLLGHFAAGSFAVPSR